MNIKALTAAVMVAAAATLTGCISVPGSVVDKSKPIDQGQYSVVADSVASTVYHFNILGFIPLPPIFADSNSASEMGENMVIFFSE